jgi:hypothetical protein
MSIAVSRVFLSAGLFLLIGASPALPAAGNPQQQARQILAATGVDGGLVVHLSCGDGKLSAALKTSDGFLVHGLDADTKTVDAARKNIRKLGAYGGVSVDVLSSTRLPYAENMVNLLVSEDLGNVTMKEVLRMLVPKGVADAGQFDTPAKVIDGPLHRNGRRPVDAGAVRAAKPRSFLCLSRERRMRAERLIWRKLMDSRFFQG